MTIEMNAYESAAARTDYRLSYTRAAASRSFCQGYMAGEDIPDAYRPGVTQAGLWGNGMHVPDGSEDVRDWFGLCVDGDQRGRARGSGVVPGRRETVDGPAWAA